MKLNWQSIEQNMSVNDIDIFLEKNRLKLKENEINKLEKRKQKLQQDNKKFAKKLLTSDIFKLALRNISYQLQKKGKIHEAREIQDLTPEDLICDDILFEKYYGKVITNMKIVNNEILKKSL
jgi:hypothetical protein